MKKAQTAIFVNVIAGLILIVLILIMYFLIQGKIEHIKDSEIRDTQVSNVANSYTNALQKMNSQLSNEFFNNVKQLNNDDDSNFFGNIKNIVEYETFLEATNDKEYETRIKNEFTTLKYIGQNNKINYMSLIIFSNSNILTPNCSKNFARNYLEAQTCGLMKVIS